ncbi:DNA translocase FtsK 4TM domain-containing protein [Suttonella sp. R2A3]|uniref:DNA translocase FtsK n=1 Tax=Suttonella sp. R2A3 TaxID=2908648 RepID=UPI001F32D4D2|nr:DNA translocase FtsK [Suttonella sp. R2A3]UJF24816.1 DNA translocase FtsK 4TM domain-containing protein [Suttonella sp. R2A3]
MTSSHSHDNWLVQLRRGFTDLWFLLSITLGIGLLLVLLGYHAGDPGWSTSGGGEAQHWFGAIGAYLADALLSLLGYGAYFIPIGLILVGWQSAKTAQLSMERLGFSVLSFVAVTIALCGILTLHWDKPINSIAVTGGGFLGQILNIELLSRLQLPLVMAIYSVIVLFGLTILLSIRWGTVLEKIGSMVFLAGAAIIAWFGLMGKKRGVDASEPPSSQAEADQRRLDIKQRLEPLLSLEDEDDAALSWQDYQSEEFGEYLSTEPQDQEPRLSSFGTQPEVEDAPMEPSLWGDDGELVIEESDSAEAEPVWPEVTAQEPPAPIDDGFDNLVDEVEERPAASVTSGQMRVRMPQGSQSPMPKTTGQQQEGVYQLPPLSLLSTPPPRENLYSGDEIEAMKTQVEEALRNYRLDVQVANVAVGPVVTRLELDLAPGIKVNQVSNLDKDLARSLSVPSVRVVDVIPGKPYIGLEIPNRKRETVHLRSVLESSAYRAQNSPLTLVLGGDIAGQPVVANLGKMPHLLVAGTTGSGKSVAINVMLASMLYKAKPDELKLILVDPKMLEMSMYEDIPHLLTPVVTDMNDAENALRWAVAEMERRYQLMAAMKVRSIAGFNELIAEKEAQGERLDDPLWRAEDYLGIAHRPPKLEKLPFIVIVIDELADMMMAVGKKVEELIARIAQKARAAGIHLILATQRPSVDVITGLIKANVPTRISFQVSSKIDSRTIIDQQGAESLLGNGDMLFVPPGSAAPQRVHGAFINDHEVDELTTFIKSQGTPDYEEAIVSPVAAEDLGAFGASEKSNDPEQDPNYDEAVALAAEHGTVSISWLQRRLGIGYNRSARIVEAMERAGVVSAPGGNGTRKVLISKPKDDF